jgi:peptidoglycan/xylan/chitin deacetylase (PgdA/CDA1 family)
VSFSFDDFPRTALTVGGKILKGVGARATYYTAVGLMDSVNELGPQFRRDDLHALLQEGHELGNHTFSHVSARATSLADYCEEVTRGNQALTEVLGIIASRNFSYPFGEVTFRVKKRVGQNIPSCRGIFRGLNGPAVDLNLLYANSLYGGTEQLAAAKALIDENTRRKTWLIFYTHDVQPHPSPYGCTPALLEEIVNAVQRSGARIVTVSEVTSLVSPH